MKTKRRKSKQRANSKERPTRQITELADRGCVQPLLQKYFRSLLKQITCLSPAVLSHRGAARDRHGRGAGCGGRKLRIDERAWLADGEVVWAFRPRGGGQVVGA